MISTKPVFDFQKVIWISALAHAAILGLAIYGGAQWSEHLAIELSKETGPANVIWASTIQSPPKTPENKLPGPILQPEPESPKDEPRIVSKPAELDKNARAKAMADALAGIRNQVERRPTPRPDNFPSISGAQGTKGAFPAGPGGGGGEIGGINADPEISAYRSKVKELLTQNLIWLQEGSPKVDVAFKIDASGNVLDARVVKSSGNSAFDAAAIRAVKKSSPLPAPPSKFVQQIDEFQVHFAPSRS